MKWICKTEEETLDLKYKLPGTVFLKKMSVILIVIILCNFLTKCR